MHLQEVILSDRSETRNFLYPVPILGKVPRYL